MVQDTMSKAEILQLLNDAYKKRGEELNTSIKLTKKALEASRKLQDSSLIGKSLTKLALYAMVKGEHEKSIKLSTEAINCFKSVDDELGAADANYSIAGVYYKSNNYHLGMFHLIDCLSIYRKHGDHHNESRTLKSLGTVYEVLGDYASAKSVYEGAIEAAQAVGDKNLESNAYNPLSGILLRYGKTQEAMDLIQRSVAMKQETGDTRGYAFAVYGRGKVYLKMQRYEEAERDFLEAVGIHKSVGDSFGIGMAYTKMGHLYVATGKIKKAKKYLKIVVKQSEERNQSLLKYKSNHFLYEIYKGEGKKRKALKYLEKYLDEKDATVNSQILKVIHNYERISRMRSLEKEASLAREKALFKRKQEQMEEATKMKQEFLSSISHEIRTPLNAVTSIISLLEERSGEKDKKLLTSLRFSSKNLLRIINDILDFSKLDSNKMKLETRSVRFKDFIHNIHSTYHGLAMEKGLLFRVNIAPEVSKYYEIDETKMFQILGNLVSNAIKYTEKGSVEMSIDLVEAQGKTDVIHFSVTDTGIGIPSKEKERLFESFYMPPSVTTRKEGGTGLGLAIVKKLVQLHDSCIGCESTPGIGSRFNFSLNLKRSKPPLQTDKTLFKQLKGRVAIVAEDNEINAMVMRELLKKWGVTLKRVNNGKQAVDMAKEEKVDFILMDIHMPVMNGYDATQMIRNTDNPNRTTPIFALTADSTVLNEETGSGYFSGVLLKPIEIDRLFEALVYAQRIKPEVLS
ncbi:tetratricopeptide repeat protein [Aureisphaera galaxeae]|uniref:ATP-binding protein n=1 Tax=Aureisphaera galaxeae TaxID=1538023 RepID=UPI00234FEEF0|nr:ATP-binding protein [Aureisphaera galaxeae]MDC8004084.1 tetratricopeptide repeat protein [Aureisphaera galaxeae]